MNTPIEPLIAAVVAALAAQQSAWYGVIVTLAVVVPLDLLSVIVIGWMSWKFRLLEKNTNSIREQLVITQRALGVAEGRAQQRKETEEEGSIK